MTSAVEEPGIGRYDLLARIGEGSRGPIYVARAAGGAGIDPLYAIEVSKFASSEDAELAAYLRNLDHAVRLRHPNVLGVIDAGQSAGGAFAVTEHIDDCTLSELQDRSRSIRPPRLVLAAVVDALHGLEAAHSLHSAGAPYPLLHGGIGAAHLRIGIAGTTRIAGFSQPRPRQQMTPSRRSRIAAGYLAPEQLTGGTRDHRSDVFSLGVVLWNALTGKKLFHDRTESSTIANVLERRVPRPSAIALSPPAVLDSVVLKALERDPARRYRTAAEMATALSHVAREAGILATPEEVADWVAEAFGLELAARRKTIGGLAGQPRRAAAELPVLPVPGSGSLDDASARDELSRDDLEIATGPITRISRPSLAATPTSHRTDPIARVSPPGAAMPAPHGAGPIAIATTPPGRAPTAGRQGSITVAPRAESRLRGRKQLVLVAVAAFAVVAGLGWRGWQMSTGGAAALAAATAELTAQPVAVPLSQLAVTVLDVRGVAPAKPDGARPEPAPAARAARHPEPRPSRADTLESNPYVYK